MKTETILFYRKASLTLMRKMLHYISPETLGLMCEAGEDGLPKLFPSQLVEVLSSVLDSEEDDDGHLLALQMSQDLLLKQKDIFLDHFARLGIFHKVLQLVGEEPQSPKSDAEDENDKLSSEEKVRCSFVFIHIVRCNFSAPNLFALVLLHRINYSCLHTANK